MRWTAHALTQALGRGDRCFHLAGRERTEAIRKRLRAQGVDVTGALQGDRLHLVTDRTWFLGSALAEPGPEGGSVRVARAIRAAIEGADAAGEGTLWWTGDVTWLLGSGDADAVEALEAQLELVMTRRDPIVFCRFDRRRLEDEGVTRVLRYHATVVLGGESHTNPFYRPPDAASTRETTGRGEWMLDQLRRTREKESALERSAERLRAVEELDRALLGARSEEELVRTAVERIREVLGAWRASVLIFPSGPTGEGRERARGFVAAEETATGIDVLSQAPRRPEGLLDASKLRQGEIHSVDDLTRFEEEELPDHLRVLRDGGLRSYVTAPLPQRARLAGILSVGYDEIGAPNEELVTLIREMADHLSLALRQARLFEAVDRAEARRREAELRLRKIAARERRRLGSELHDRLGQELTGLAFGAEALRRSLERRGAHEATEAASLEEGISEAIETVRRLARGLLFESFGDRDLADALLELSREAGQRLGVEVGVDIEADVLFGSDETAHLSRIAQEAIVNAVRHGGARRVEIEVGFHNGGRFLRVVDDGRGFDPGAVGEGSPGSGLRTMGYRAEALGGSLEVESERGSGAVITCRLPLNPLRDSGSG